ncbi:Macrophage migration inhibitory factor [Portunus trituberculatus]|uniref:L-dopachrome isomerase n=1 Tax=Portunus trituberculatus TaxID=210409 RepID=A0A5B7E2H8_PORTR|nr:Macrophage migration inhibitory factor [Portunus trituberculatus]
MHVLPDQLMSFGGSSEPCASVRLSSIGRLGVELNKTYAAKIFVFMEKHLGISNDRIFLELIIKETISTLHPSQLCIQGKATSYLPLTY